MEYGARIKDYVIDLEEVLYYHPHNSNDNDNYFITFYFRKNDRYITIKFEDKSERNFYLKELNDECVEEDLDLKDKFQVEINQI